MLRLEQDIQTQTNLLLPLFAVCPVGFDDVVPGGKYCYKFHKKADANFGAFKKCFKENSELAIPLSKTENELLAKYLNKKSSGAISWSTISVLRSKDGKFKWAGNRPLSYSNWQRGRPKSEKCTVLNIQAKHKSKFMTWEDVNCKKKVPFTCMKAKEGWFPILTVA